MTFETRILIFILLIISLLFTSKASAQNPKLEKFLQEGNLKYAGIGIKVAEISTGKSICAYNENQSLCSASCLKLATTAAALESLGDEFRFETSLLTDGVIDSQGNLKGNLYIQGVGDPTLGSEYLGGDPLAFLDGWLAGVRKAGIKSVSGSVIALDDLFGYEGVSPKWLWVDMGNYYAPGIYGISIFDNTYRLYLKSREEGSVPEIIKCEPSSLGLEFENNLKAAANNLDSAYIYGIPFSPDRRIFGTIPQNKSSFVIKGDIPDPGIFLATYFTDFLKKNAIPVAQEATSFRLSPKYPRQTINLAKTISPPLRDIVKVVNFRSNNHYAEHLFRKLELGRGVKNYWKSKGLDVGGLFMYDGSGLSPSDGITAEFLTNLLVYMNNKSKYSAAFYNSLPQAGKEGTVISFLNNTVLEGKVRAKSGSMEDVISYSGYVNQNGKRYAFTVIVNKYTGNKSTVKQQIEQLLVRLFDNPNANV